MDDQAMDHRHDAPMKTLMAELSERGIQYCHWKSNEHLEAGMIGDTDLDVLFCAEDEAMVDAVLTKIGYKRVESVWYNCYPGVESYIALNPENGKLLHVHAHFALIIGESGVKNFILPWGNEYLEESVPDPNTGFMIAAPAEELLLLMIRDAIKIRFPTPLRLRRKRSEGSERADSLREFAWLKARTNSRDLEEVTARRLGPQCTPSVLSLYQSGFSKADLRIFYAANEELLLQFRRVGPLQALARRWVRSIGSQATRVLARTGWFVVSSRHVVPDVGLVVAILGSDGAGKSTLLDGLRNRLSTKLDVLSVYLGSGQGKSGLLRGPLVLMRRIIGAKSQGKSGSRPRPRLAPRKGSLPHTVFNFLWAVTLAYEKKQKVRLAARARNRGMVVITDRYPQTSVPGYNDGPLLSHLKNSQWRLLRAIAHWEHCCYDERYVPQPDLVLKLVGDPAVLAKRRPELNLETIRERQAGALRLKFPSPTKVVQLDANLSPAEILNAAMIAIMTELTASDRGVR